MLTITGVQNAKILSYAYQDLTTIADSIALYMRAKNTGGDNDDPKKIADGDD